MKEVTPTSKHAYHKGIKPEKTWLRSLDEIRAKIIRFLSCPTPGLKNSIPIFGGRTLMELLVFAAIIVVSLVIAAAGDSSGVANICGLFCIVLAFRYNYLIRLFNLSFGRALFWHKIMALVFIAAMIIHAVSVGANATGLVIVISACFMSAIYLVKPYQFEVFYYFHLASLIICCIACYFHGASLVAVGGAVWILDLILRYGLFSHRISAKAYVLPGDVVRLEFPACFSYGAGQYCFLRIYDINPFEFHPFSLSSGPNQETTTIHIRALGNWTKKLLAYVTEKQGKLEKKEDGVPIDVLCEGPFGMSMVDWENPEYEVFLLVSGGVGITPLQSVFSELIYANQNLGRHIRKAVFVWSVKDLDLVKAVHDPEEGRYTHAINQIGAPELARKKCISFSGLPRSFQPILSEIPEVIYDENKSNKGSGKSEEENSATAVHPTTVDRHDSLSDSVYAVHSSLVFLPRFHLTALKTKDHVRSNNDDPTLQFILKPGRPDLKKIFNELREMCVKEGFKRVAVLVCGPQPMVNDVDDLCRDSKLSCADIRFDCHKEVFDF